MKPGKLDLPPIWRGCDWGPVTLKWKDPDGNPINLSGWQAVAQSLNVNLNPSITDVLMGETQLNLTKDTTANLKLGVENWDWIWQTTAGNYRFPPFLAGKVEIKEPISGAAGSLIPPLPPDTPVATGATLISSNRFNANWNAAPRATGYRIDISTDALFTSFVPGYQNLDVHNVVTFTVTGLLYSTTYYYRLRAYNQGGTTNNSNVINVTTAVAPPPLNDDFFKNLLMVGLIGSTTGTTAGATTEPGEPSGTNSVWYRWLPGQPVFGTITLDTSAMRISVYLDIDPVHPAVNNLQHVATSVVQGGQAVVNFLSTLNRTHRIRVYKNTDVGPFTMSWTYQQPREGESS